MGRGQPVRQDERRPARAASIIVFDYEGTAVKRYKLTNAWPKSLEIGTLKAGDTSYLSEKLVLTCESIEVQGA